MTTEESRRTMLEARRAAGASTVPPSRRQSAMDRYLAAEAYSTTSPTEQRASTATRPAAPKVGPPPAAGAPGATGAVGSSRPGGMVIAGIDGSGCARHAARWAATEAVRLGVPLQLVHAYSLPPAGHSGYNPYPPNMLSELREDGNALLHDTAAELRRAEPELQIGTRQVYGETSTVLRHASADAVLTVVGAHGNSRLAAVALGSVAADIASTNPVPVAVIRPGDAPVHGAVVVGVDGSPTSEAAIDYAFAAAAERGCQLLAVHCWTEPGTAGSLPTEAAVIVDLDRVKKSEQRLLAGRLAGWTRKYPKVQVRQLLVHGTPAATLLDHAAAAQLIVVGNRGRGGIMGMLLGSTSLALITHSPVPVVIARPRPESG